MNLQFTNKGGNFVSEFEVSSDFNLHIEGVRLSDMRVYQKTAGGSYAIVTGFPTDRSADRVADFDFASLVYPKIIKVVCPTEPTYAEVVTDGEVTEIKSQSKEVEITANGVTEIAPDAGFGYLSGVKVNVNVPQGGGSEGGGDTMEYINIEGYDNFAYPALLADYVKLVSEGKTLFMSSMEYSKDAYSSIAPLAIAINTKRRVNVVLGRPDEGMYTYKEIVTKMGMASVLDLPRITEEEFYTL